MDPDELRFDALREYYKSRNVWMPNAAKDRDEFVMRIQHRRNSIHAYKNRDIGSFDEFWQHVRDYVVLLDDLTGRTPDLPCQTMY
jgi:hypothetical protein